jgi:Glutaredoxin-like domain (DUF836)
MSEWRLFGTDGCHLCEDARLIAEAAGLSVEVLDIIDNDQWQSSYALRIPVLHHCASAQELDWPFNRQQLAYWRQNLQSASK